MNTKNTDVVAEYLHEVDVRLAGLPVLQRRELLADLAAHIASERAERNIQTEGELIEVLERLGSPDVVAAAAHEEFGPAVAPPSAKKRIPWYWPAAAIATVVVVLFLCAGAFFWSSSSGPEPSIEQVTPVPAPSMAPSR
ncbi:HAAS signaling domain-containing protein [Paractinoplanes durhamensis]|uniref:Anti-sigma factor n=1 Tax=Paractinoplanes durhamensis TaxID=113563 RepID=A0ABQ3Z1D0_9ACTN|nr:hypothetical protein [Actinoplanes durhamensis]GIE03635.1 hypothetical protein Adu01nite_49850 [Actinoplanes durhamensis]